MKTYFGERGLSFGGAIEAEREVGEGREEREGREEGGEGEREGGSVFAEVG